MKRLGLSLVTVLMVSVGFAAPAYAAPDLNVVRDELLAWAPVGSTLRIDRDSGQVVVRLPGRVPAALATVQGRHRGRVHLEQAAPVAAEASLYGGHGMVGGGSTSCTTGFMASAGQVNYVITAGHCTDGAYRWTRKGDYLGLSASSVYSGDGDFGLIAIHGVNFTPKPAVNTQYGVVGIIGTHEAVVGEQLCKMGNNSQYTCGTVLGLDVTVVYSDATIHGMIETTICAVGGDSGGPVMTPYRVGPMVYAYGVGIHSGGGGSCSAGTRRSYHQPIQEILDWHGLDLRPLDSA